MAWNEVLEGSGVWVHSYDVSFGPTNAIAIRLDAEELAVLSPPTGMADADFAALAAKGRVSAIIAPHSGHDLGLPSWRARYPEARLYAPSVALPTLARLGLGDFTDLSALVTPPEVRFREVLGSKNGGTLARVLRGPRPVVYIDELIGNQVSLPRPLLLKLAFGLSGSSPGLRLNRVFMTFLCTDTERMARTLLDAMDGEPVLIPSHGTPLRRPEEVARARELLRSLV